MLAFPHNSDGIFHFTGPCGIRWRPLLPDSHEPQQGPTRVVDLWCGTLHISALLTWLKVLSPPTICHLLGEQELAGLGHFSACHPAKTDNKTGLGTKESLHVFPRHKWELCFTLPIAGTFQRAQGSESKCSNPTRFGRSGILGRSAYGQTVCLPRLTLWSHPTPETKAEKLPNPYSPITVFVLHTGKCLQTKPGAVREANSPAPRREGRPVLSRVLEQRQVVTLLHPQQE